MAKPWVSAVTNKLPWLDRVTNVALKLTDPLVGEQAPRSLKDLLVGVPVALDALDDGLFRAMRDSWFSDDNARTLEATLAQPIVTNLLQPARRFLDRVEYTLDSWENQVAQPVNNALSQRQIVIRQITEYKDKNGLA